MTCSQTEKISLLIDGELPQSEMRAVEQHMQQCGECYEAHEAFLNLRSQISSYNLALDPASTNLALAKVLSRADNRAQASSTAGWRERLPSVFGIEGPSGFSPRFAAMAALVVLAFTIGGIALLRYRPQPDVSNNSATHTTPEVGLPSASPEQLADNRRPKGKAAGSERQPSAPQINKGLKPGPAPQRIVPQQRRRTEAAAPNYSTIEATVASTTKPLPRAEVESLTARHLEQSELLLRTFRNVRAGKAGRSAEIQYERERAQQLLYQNMLVRREADAAGDVQVAALLGSLEPILLDIANLRNKPRNEELTAIQDRVERKSLVPLLQINSTAVARAYE